MKRKKITLYLIIFCVAGLSIGSSVNAFSISTDKKSDQKTSILKTQDNDFEVGYMEIDPTKLDPDDRATVELLQNSFTVENYIAGEPIRFSADYKIAHDIFGPWDEAPYPVNPVHHTTTIEKWEFKIRAEHHRVNGDVFFIGTEIVEISDCQGETPPEILLVQAPSSVIEGEDFQVRVTFQGFPTYDGFVSDNEEVTFNGQTKENSPVSGIVTFTAPEVDQDTIYDIEAEKDWQTDDDHNPGNIFTYGSTKIEVLDNPYPTDLIVITDSSVMERQTFEIYVKGNGVPIPGAEVIFLDRAYTTDPEGKAIVTAPSVDFDTEYEITATILDFIAGTTKMTVVADYDDEADLTDESGTTGTVTLELNLDRDQFYRPFPTENGVQEPIEIKVFLSCTRYIWCWKPPKFEWEDTSWEKCIEGTFELDNQAPVVELNDGPLEGRVGESYSYTAVATDPDNDPIHYYEFYWEYEVDPNGNIIWDTTFDNDHFTGFDSGEPCTHSHIWGSNYNDVMYICAEDAIGDKFCIQFPIKMPKEKLIQNSLMFQILKRFPIYEKIKDLTIFNLLNRDLQ